MLRASKSLCDLNQCAHRQRDRRSDHKNADRDKEYDQEDENRLSAERRDPAEATGRGLDVIHDGPDCHAGDGGNRGNRAGRRDHDIHLYSVRFFACVNCPIRGQLATSRRSQTHTHLMGFTVVNQRNCCEINTYPVDGRLHHTAAQVLGV